MANNDHLNKSMCIEREMPFSWKGISDSFSDTELAAINQNNTTLLNTITVMEEQAHVDIYDHSQSSQEITRIDAKLDLLTNLVTRLVFQNQMIPPAEIVQLSDQTVGWQGQTNPAIGEAGVIELFIHPVIAVPLQLPVTIIKAKQSKIFGLSKDVQNALEKYLFTQHRRSIAESRKRQE